MEQGNRPKTLTRRTVCASLGLSILGTSRPGWAQAGTQVLVTVPSGGAIERSGRFNGYRFDYVRSARKGDSTEYQRLSVKELPSGELQLHRRNDNGVAGSGVLATVRFTKEETPSEAVMRFELLGTSTYQEGLFLKKAVPPFDLKETLLEGVVNTRLELDSEYSVDAVRANFKRMAMLAGSPGGKEMWRVATPSGQQYVQLEFFPYRAGTKVGAFASIVGRETSPGQIDFAQLIRQLEATLKAVVAA